MNVARLITDIGDRYARRTAAIDLSGEQPLEVTYADLVRRTRSLGLALRSMGMRPGDRLAVALDNCCDLVVSEWCCLVEGFVWVALNIRSSKGELAEVLVDSEPSLVITNSRHAATLRAVADATSIPLKVIGTSDWQAFVSAGSSTVPTAAPAEQDPVRIRYTSGTSGRAKGAVLSRGVYDASVEVVADVIGPLGPTDVVAQVAPMTHASGAMLLPHLAVGGSALLIEGFDAPSLVDCCRRYRVSSLFLVPTMLIRFLAELSRSEGLPELRTIVYGGAATPPETIADAVKRFGPIFVQIYGLTESTWPVCALLRDEHAQRDREPREQWLARLASCGKPTAIGRVRIVDADGTDVAEGEAGELWVRGRNTMSGYWRAADDGGKGLDKDGWMHTGDIGVRDEYGRVTIVDRLHDMIVSGGFNVYPREVEDALASHAAVLESAVVGRPHAEWGEAVHACVVLKPQMTVTGDELIGHVAGRLAGYKKPKSLEFVRALPKNASGKVLRRVLREQLRNDK
jgi:acyl-CoA synthetase (AMP-forming)/AMP-acid ligase II